jgi:hypothetical protein
MKRLWVCFAICLFITHNLFAQSDLKLDPTQVATVKDLTFKRDVATFTLKDGTIYLCKSASGAVDAAVFIGNGVLDYTPPIEVEKKQLARFYKSEHLTEKFKSLFFIFTDSTKEELAKKLIFASAAIKSDAESKLKAGVKYTDTKSLRQVFLNRKRNGFFYAHIFGEDNGELFFQVNPYDDEEISLYRLSEDNPMISSDYDFDLINQFHQQTDLASGIVLADKNKDLLKIQSYIIDGAITPTKGFNNDLDLTATVQILFSATEDTNDWLYFDLLASLRIDKITWGDGTPLSYVRKQLESVNDTWHSRNWELWIKPPVPLEKGKTYTLNISYYGEAVTKKEALLFLWSSTNWYPHYNDRGTVDAVFDLTFHYPSAYDFVSVGNNVSSKTENNVTASRWVTKENAKHASFNIGFFKSLKIEKPNLPPITILRSKTTEVLSTENNMIEKVGEDIEKSLGFFQSLFGKCPMERLTVTEIPYRHGQAFPNLTHFSWTTFIHNDRFGWNEIFRSHEVSHQWWGLSLSHKTYHDQWLDEAFAEYSGLWYMQAVLKDNDKFFDRLNGYKKGFLENLKYLFGWVKGQEAGPIWLGGRVSSSRTRGDYSLIIYAKGAWVLHMLRNMMIDLKTMNEDKFIAMLRDYYQTYNGKAASTEDFKRIVEKHIGTDMTWFFDQWVYGTDIPKYDFSYTTEQTPDGKYKLKCRVTQENVPDNFQMYVPIRIQLDGNKGARLRLFVTGKVTEKEFPLPLKPEKVTFNEFESVLCEY